MSKDKLYFKEVKDGVAIKLADVSKEEIEDALTIRKRLDYLIREKGKIDNEMKELYGKCEHTVRFDEPGYMYDLRTCAACGKIDCI